VGRSGMMVIYMHTHMHIQISTASYVNNAALCSSSSGAAIYMLTQHCQVSAQVSSTTQCSLKRGSCYLQIALVPAATGNDKTSCVMIIDLNSSVVVAAVVVVLVPAQLCQEGFSRALC
jgi:hypothetical protein